MILVVIGLYIYHKKRQQYFARSIITKFELRMFKQLNLAFPQYHILAQVAFSALITSKDIKVRNKFNRKVTDFVVVNHKFQVKAIIELDDPSHLTKVKEDQLRDKMLNEAGYQVLRYTEIPSIRRLQRDIS
ncbi:DUF2726 domain-containing protein [Acinetobacter sp. MD2]|uniref:DUF2726 domain-containing protein n=1 Tax=Acinetobacter sp. MD2 TaxID=2600066 RepID=UPI003B636F21